MELRGKPGSFSAYLNSGPKQNEASSQSAPAATALDLLRLVANAPNREVQLAKLAEMSAMDATSLHKSLQELSDSKFVSVSGPALEANVSLTDLGSKVAGLS